MLLNLDAKAPQATLPRTIAGIEKIPCKLFITKRKGELEKAELLVKGPINSTAEKLTINALIAIKHCNLVNKIIAFKSKPHTYQNNACPQRLHNKINLSETQTNRGKWEESYSPNYYQSNRDDG